MAWNKETQKEYTDNFNKRRESGELIESVFDFLDDYLPQNYNLEDETKNKGE